MKITTDFLVLGSGIAGLSFALEASKYGQVHVVTKRSISSSATQWAQGGIAAVFDPEDSFEAHVEDTLRVGGGIGDPEIVASVIREGPDRVKKLLEYGVQFSREQNADAKSDFDLTREGGHSARRVVHAGDMTGREVQRGLVRAVQENDRIVVHEHFMAIDLIEMSRFSHEQKVVGAYVLDEEKGEVHTFLSAATVLATGGAGKVYLYTSNPDVATGDGIAMAYRAGAQVANMEFFQFHPTCLYHPDAKSFLISEALRGEGGVLRLSNGYAFMKDHHHPMCDLAPRDVVARAIDFEMKRTGEPCVYLDMSACKPSYLLERFPNIDEQCKKFGIDMVREPIPVVPAAHYMCGGVVVNHEGQSTLPGLWAIGEVSYTGLHGANRLASNSLLEGLVYGHRAAKSFERLPLQVPDMRMVPEWDVGEAVPSDEEVVISHNWDELRRTMWNYVGVVRSDKRLRRASRRVSLLNEEIREYYWKHLISRDLLELRNIATVAEVIVRSAMARKESRGLHFTLDYPDSRDDQFLGAMRIVKDSTPFVR